MPVASQSLGYMLIWVKPGMVLTSLTKMRRLPSGSIRKSTRARPDRSQARKASTAIARIWRDSARACALTQLAVLKRELGSLDRVEEVVSMNGYVNAVAGFADSPA